MKVSAWTALGLACLAAITVVIRIQAGPWSVDDAYITFRHSRNLVEGLGFVYNPGQRVLGTSSPLFGLLLAAAARLTKTDFPQIAVAVNAAADAVAVLVLFLIARKLHVPRWASLMMSAAWAAYPIGIRYSIGGMESSLAAAFLLVGFLAYLSDRNVVAAVIFGFAILTRPEALVAPLVIVTELSLRHRAIAWRPILALVAAVVPWLVFALAEYGNVVPQSVRAKAAGVYPPTRWVNTPQIIYQLGTLVSSDRRLAAAGLQASLPGPVPAAIVVGIVALAGSWCLGLLSLVRRDVRALPFLLTPVLVITVYAIAGRWGRVMAEWYLVPFTPMLLAGAFAGLGELARSHRRVGAAPVAAGVALLAIQIAGFNLSRDKSRGPWVPRVVWTEREDLYRKAAEFLRPRLRPDDVVAASEIGALGYFCECRVLDTVGLVSPEALSYYPLPPEAFENNYAVPVALVRERAPEYFVTFDLFIRRTLARSEWFASHYEPIWQAETRVFSSQHLSIFRRSDRIDPRS